MALQIAHFQKGNTPDSTGPLEVHEKSLQTVLNVVGARPISVISICGPANLGKSFLLNYILRCLEAAEKGVNDWVGDPRKALEGFNWQWRASCSALNEVVTKGVVLWNKPFILKNPRGKEYAVLVLDTQGVYDDFSSVYDDLSIIGLCLLLSSVTILNLIPTAIQEVLDSLKVFCEYGDIFQTEYGGKAFDKLWVLMRDFKESVQYPLTTDGGRRYLEIELINNRVSKSKVEKEIRNYFTDYDCFLLPDRGSNTKGASYNGNFLSLSKLFRGNMERFIGDLVNNDLQVKKICRKQLTAKDFSSHFKAYVELFNKCTLRFPKARAIFSTTTRTSRENLIEEGLIAYRKLFHNVNNGPQYMTENAFENAHKEGEKKAMNYFRSNIKFQVCLQATFELLIRRERQTMKAKNDEKRGKAWANAEIAAIDIFRVQFTEKFGKTLNDAVFIRKQAGIAKGNAFTEFLNRLCGDESETEIQYLWRPLQYQFDDIVASFVFESDVEQRRLQAEAEEDEQSAYFNCPICFEVPKCKVFQCVNGHVICEKCSDGMHQCPQCRVNLTGSGKIRNRAVEEILEKLSCR